MPLGMDPAKLADFIGHLIGGFPGIHWDSLANAALVPGVVPPSVLGGKLLWEAGPDLGEYAQEILDASELTQKGFEVKQEAEGYRALFGPAAPATGFPYAFGIGLGDPSSLVAMTGSKTPGDIRPATTVGEHLLAPGFAVGLLPTGECLGLVGVGGKLWWAVTASALGSPHPQRRRAPKPEL